MADERRGRRWVGCGGTGSGRGVGDGSTAGTAARRLLNGDGSSVALASLAFVVRLQDLVREVDVASDHHGLELEEVVDGQDGREDELVEVRVLAALDDLGELVDRDAHLGEKVREQALDELLELLVYRGVLELVLLLAVEHHARLVDEAHQRRRIHRSLYIGASGRGRLLASRLERFRVSGGKSGEMRCGPPWRRDRT